MRTLQCAFALLICLAFSSFSFGQEKTQPVKFDSYVEKKDADLKLLEEKLQQFFKYLQKEPKTTKGVILYFPQLNEAKCFSEVPTTAGKQLRFIDNLLRRKYRNIRQRINIDHNGMYRTFTEFEFWIVPRNSAELISTGYIVDCFCIPRIEVTGDTTINRKVKTVSFSIDIADNTGLSEYIKGYEWKVSAGEIIEGQGLPVIKVDITNVKENEITATMKILGLGKSFYTFCKNSASFTTKIQ